MHRAISSYPMEFESFENPLSTNAKVGIGVGVLAVLGVGAYFLLKKPAAASSSSSSGVPNVGTPGPYTPVAVTPASASVPVAAPYMQQGETYLLSMSPIAGMALATAVSNLQTASAQSPSGKVTVLQSWDVGQVPSNWPSSDQGTNEWRMVLSINGGPQPIPVPLPGAQLFSTAGAVAGLPVGVGAASKGMTQPMNIGRMSPWYPIAPAAVGTSVPSYIIQAFTNWYNGSGSRPAPLPAGMPPAPAGAWTGVAIIGGQVRYFAARLQNGIQWWYHPPFALLPLGVGQVPQGMVLQQAAAAIASTNPNGIVPVPSGFQWARTNRPWPGSSSNPIFLAPRSRSNPTNAWVVYQLEGALMRCAFAYSLNIFNPMAGLSWATYEWAPTTTRMAQAATIVHRPRPLRLAGQAFPMR